MIKHAVYIVRGERMYFLEEKDGEFLFCSTKNPNDILVTDMTEKCDRCFMCENCGGMGCEQCDGEGYLGPMKGMSWEEIITWAKSR